MSSDKALHRGVVTNLTTVYQQLEHDVAKLTSGQVAKTVLRVLHPLVGDLVGVLRKALDTLREALEGSAAPALMWERSTQWRHVAAVAAATAGVLGGAEAAGWSGDAATAYEQAKGRQAAAARRIATVADAMASGLADCAQAGLKFYGEMLTIAVELASDVAAAAAEAATVVGLVAEPVNLGVFAASIAAMMKAAENLEADLQKAASQVHEAQVEALEDFPGGQWPVLGGGPAGASPGGSAGPSTVPPGPGSPGPSSSPGSSPPRSIDPGIFFPTPGSHADPTWPGSASPAPVTVQPGDSLWSIAARHLGPDATTKQINDEWPRWWSANRDLIGPNPNLILPGGVLRPPPAQQTEII